MKKFSTILLSLTMIFMLVACGGDKANDVEKPKNQNEQQMEVQTEAPTQTSEEIPVASTKTLAYFQKFLSGGEYTMDMITTAEGMTIKVKSAYKDDMVYSESEYDGMKSVVIMKDGYQYVIDHSSKTCIKMQIMDEGAVTDMFAKEAANYETAAATGTTDYNGKSYDYEEFTVEGETVQYLFDGNDLKVMKATVMGIESIVEIVSVEKGADASLFEIPADYQMMTY